MKRVNWNVSEMNVIIMIHTKTTILITVSNVANVIQLILREIGLLTDSVLPRFVFSLSKLVIYFDSSAQNQM